jgi:hypothetical protein
MNAKTLLLSLLVGFTSVLNGYSGGDDLEKVRFYYKGDKGLSPKTCLYKIDNETKPDFISGYLPFGYNKIHQIGDFDIELAPGSHTFEIVLNDKNTMTKKSKSVIAKKITLNMEFGKEYILERNDFEIDIVCKSEAGETKAEYTIDDVSVFAEPSSGEPFATIQYVHEKDAEFDPYISRIDDQITAGLGELYGACNYALPVDFKYFSGTNGELNLKIQPGVHKFEYLVLGVTVANGLVQIEEFAFEAGKKYKILLDEIKSKNAKSLATVRIIEDK